MVVARSLYKQNCFAKTFILFHACCTTSTIRCLTHNAFVVIETEHTELVNNEHCFDIKCRSNQVGCCSLKTGTIIDAHVLENISFT